jgi:hypothetical protein
MRLQSTDEFWTLESRSVDSLGLISRDLGRELSLNQFLLALAPDLVQYQYSPLVPEAHECEEVVKSSHIPACVEINRHSQQTAIRWRVSPKDNRGNGRFTLSDYMSNSELRSFIAYTKNARTCFDVYSATMQGDDKSVDAVKSRIALIVKPNSEIAGLWQAIKECLMVCIKQKAPFDVLGRAINLAGIFCSMGEMEHSWFHLGVSDVNNVWRNALGTIADSLGDTAVADIPRNIYEVFKRTVVFDATKYWLDWSRKKGIGDDDIPF